MDSMRKIKPAVMAIIKSGDRYLFVRRAPHKPAGGFWCPVSGKVEPGETRAAAVEREAFEEVGLRVRAIQEVGQMPNSTQDYLLHWWTTELLDSDPLNTATVKAKDEIDAIIWLAKHEFYTLVPSFAEDLDFISKHA